jgi:TPR repeat protein
MGGAQVGLGVRRFHGAHGVQQDAADGAAYLQQAARAEDPLALANYGYMLANGWGVERDPARAVELFERAAAMGHAGGMVGLGFAHSHGLGVAGVNHTAALEWYRRAAALGDAMGHFNLGEMLRSGTGLPGGPDLAAALPHLRAAAALGHFKALYLVRLAHWVS